MITPITLNISSNVLNSISRPITQIIHFIEDTTKPSVFMSPQACYASDPCQSAIDLVKKLI